MADGALTPILLDADPLYIGYDWEIPVTLTDDATGAPIDISAWMIGGDLLLPFAPLVGAIPLAVANLDVPSASWAYEVPRDLTSTVKLDGTAPRSYPCRIMAWYEASGKRFALRPIYIQPLDPRTA